MDKKRVNVYLTLCDKHTDTGHRVEEDLHISPPRLLVIHRRRIVSLSDTTERVAFKVCAKKVYAVYHLPLKNTLKLTVRNVVSGRCIGLGKYLLFSGLRCSARELHRSKAIYHGSAEPVHTGDVEVLVVRHTSAVGYELRHKVLLAHEVTCELVAVRVAEVVYRLKECRGEKIGYKLPVIESDNLVSVVVKEEKVEIFHKAVAVSLGEFFLKNKAPRISVTTQNLRLVGEEAVKRGAEFVASWSAHCRERVKSSTA